MWTVSQGHHLPPLNEGEIFGKTGGVLFELENFAAGGADENASGAGSVVSESAVQVSEASICGRAESVGQHRLTVQHLAAGEVQGSGTRRVEERFERRAEPGGGHRPVGRRWLTVPAPVLTADLDAFHCDLGRDGVDIGPFRRAGVTAVALRDFIGYEVRHACGALKIHLAGVLEVGVLR